MSPGKEPLVPTGYEIRLTPELVWMLWKLWNREKALATARNRTSAFQPVAHHYPD
jgi:hypothetical protein